MENKAETPFGKSTAKRLPDPPQASTFAALWFGRAVYRSSLLRDFHLSASCCGNSMKSRSDGCQDQMGFSKNSTHMDSWWWPNSKRLPTQIGAAADLALPSPGVWTLSLNPRDSLEFAALGFHQKLTGFPQRKCWWINRSDRVSYPDVYAAFSLSRAGLSPVLSSVKVLSNYYMIITHCSFSQA